MVDPKDSMLEAFRNAGSEGAPAGGPFAPDAPAPSRAPANLAGEAGAWAGEGRGVLLAVAAVVVAFLLGLFLGRSAAGGADEVEAAQGDTGRAEPAELFLGTPSGSDPVARSSAPPAGVDGAVSPLYDPRNKYTIVAIAYGPSYEDLAWENYDHLSAAGLPAFTPFVAPNGKIVLVVGAAPLESELRDVQRRLQALDGPDGTPRAYADAYINPIRKIVPAAPR